jgi:MFS transporter, PAT family, beta-lactamase induction signal transducer AmpG
MGIPDTAALPVSGAAARPRAIHPVAYLLMILPFGASSGYIGVTLGYQLSHAGVDADGVATLIAMSFFPQTLKFLWAPLTDATLTRRTWFLIGALITCGTFTTCATIHIDAAALPLLTVLMVAQSAATTLMAMAVEALVVSNTPADQRGRTSAWFQAGNMGGNGVGGGAALLIAQHATQPWLAPATLGAATLLCALPLLWFTEPPRHLSSDAGSEGRSLLAQKWSELMLVLKDIWILVTSRHGFLALLVLFLPLGTGAAGGLWAPAADLWHASADTVAIATGALSGLVSMAGCFVAGPLLDRMDRKNAYLLFGAVQAAIAIAMAVAPRSEATYAFFTLAYSFAVGLSFAAYAAVVLEIAGLRSAATQWNVYSALSNVPIQYMIKFDGVVFTRYGPSSMLWFEALVAFASIAIFAIAIKVSQRTGAKS